MKRDAMEIGGRSIYELFRQGPRRTPWEKLAADTRAAYRGRMQELVNELSSAGFEIVGTPKARSAGAAARRRGAPKVKRRSSAQP